MIINDVDAKHDISIWNIYYQMRIDEKCDNLLKTQATKLVALSATMDTWKQSKYGSQLKFCDTATLADARTMWLFYSSIRGKAATSVVNKRLETVVDTSERMKDSRDMGVLIASFRSAAPAHARSVMDMDALYKRFWKYGTVDHAVEASLEAKLPNPMFLTLDGTSFLHYVTDPLLGFHLVTAYAPLEPQSQFYIPDNLSSQLQKVVDAARLEFRQWAASFRRRAGTITLRFLAGDAIAFAYTLQQARASGSPTAGFYRDRYQFEPLVLMESDYGATGSAPLLFDVVDTSNLCDHAGSLNLLTAVSPLLLNKLASTVYTNVISMVVNSREKVLDAMLCGDTPTVSTLLALFPVEYWTNASCVSYGDNTFVDSVGELRVPSQLSVASNKGQGFLRIAWKRPPCLASSGDTTDLSLVPLRFAEQELAQILYQIYVRMFDDEDWAKKFANLPMDVSAASADLNPQPQYHRAGLAAFLRLVQRRVLCDKWDKTMQLFCDLVVQRPNAMMGMHYFQELCAYLHVLGVHTADIFKDRNLVSGMEIAPARSQHLGAWTNNAPVICITLKVPRKHLKAFTELDRLTFGTPTCHCKVAGGASWENLFPACQFSFGEIWTTGVRNSDEFEVCITEDKEGWNGDSDLIVTFYTPPSWAILRDYSSTTVSFGLHQTPAMLRRFIKHYGPMLSIYETAINNTENVYITKYAPHQKVFPMVPGFTLDQLKAPSNMNGTVTQTVTAVGHPQTGCFVTMVGRLDIGCKKLQATLRDGASVIVGNPTPCHSTVTLGQHQPLDLFFPVPVLSTNQKTRIARKSSYIEIITQVATSQNSAEFPTSFVYPLFLTGSKKVPLTWSMPHLDLDKQPALNLLQVSKIDWLDKHFYMQMSSRERALRDDESLPRSPGERVRLEFKESLLCLMLNFAGLQDYKPAAIFGISMPEKGGILVLIFPNKFRIDLANRAVVLDCAILPIRKDIIPKLAKFLHGLRPPALVQIKVDEAELSMWKQVLPSWVERCRTDWSHGDECEYRAAGRIPLTDQHDDAQILCSCGQGVFPVDFSLAGVPGWLSLGKKYSTRAAISPVFWAPFAGEVYMPPTGLSVVPTASVGCNPCGVKQKKDGKSLMKCGGCRLAEYCSVECQKKDWKTHKTLCSSRRC